MSLSVKIAGQSAFFLAGNIFTLIVGFALQVYLARQLGADGLGVFGLLESGIGVVTAVLGLGVAQTTLRYLPAHLKREEFAMVRNLVRKGFKILLLSGGTGLLFTAAALPMITVQWPQLAEYKVEIIVMMLFIPSGLLLFYSSQVLRGFQDVRHMVIGTSFLQLTIKALLSILLISLGYHLIGYIWAVIAATLCALAWMLIGIRKHLAKITSQEVQPVGLLPEWKSYAKIMYGNTMLNFWSKPLDRFVLAFFVGPAAVGVLMIGKTLYALPGVFLQMFLSIVAPMMASAHADDDYSEIQHIYHLCTDWLIRISLPLVVFLIVFATPVLNQFGERFAAEGTLLLQILLLAQLINLMCGPVGNVLNMCGLEKIMFRISIISTIGGAAVLVAAVYIWGIPGAGAGLLFTTIYANLAAIRVARNHLDIHWWDRRYIKWFLPLLVTVLVAFPLATSAQEPLALIASLLLLYAIFHGSLWMVHGISEDDRDIMNAILNKLPGRAGVKE